MGEKKGDLQRVTWKFRGDGHVPSFDGANGAHIISKPTSVVHFKCAVHCISITPQ